MKVKGLIVAGAVSLSLMGATGAQAARDYISIVGSSTVYPFATVVAEQFGKTTNFKTPKIESTGSGGGFKLSVPVSVYLIPTSPTLPVLSRNLRLRNVRPKVSPRSSK